MLLIPLLAACGEGTPAESVTEPAVRDSAGIAIVEYPQLPTEGFGGWSVDPRPALSIGSMDGPEEEQLYRVRGGTRLPDGRIALGNRGSAEIRFYGPDGAYLTMEGGRGGGPGEYEQLTLMGRIAGDTLVIDDFQNNRLSFVHPDDGFIRSIPARESGVFGFTRGVLANGSALRGGGLFFNGDEELSTGFRRDQVEFSLADRDGRVLETMAGWQGPEMYFDVGEGFISANSVPYGRDTYSTARGDRVVIGQNDDYTIHEYAPTGDLIRIIRSLGPLRPVTRELIQAAYEDRIEDADDDDEVRRIRAAMSEVEAPETLPAYQALHIDTEGYLWVQDQETATDDESRWTVFGRDGRVAARLALPTGLRVLEIGTDYVLAATQDEFDVEFVHLYLLSRGG
jgi:hypothetical protein